MVSTKNCVTDVYVYNDFLTIGITIQGGNIYTVGLDGTLLCSTDLSVTSMQWIYNLQVLNSTSSSEVQLSFSPVNETIHGREYTCRSTSPYGIQESTYQITTQSELQS